MTRYGKAAAPLANPVQLADNAVLALASLERDAVVKPELLNDGIKLCEYLVSLLEDLKGPEDRKAQFLFRAVFSDKKSLQNTKIDLEDVRQVKEKLTDLLRDPASYTKKEIEDMQRFLVMWSMPLWQHRIVESEERRLRRGLFTRD